MDKMKWNGVKWSEMKWNEVEWNGVGGEMKWNERQIFLENIECQVPLIFTLYFLYKTANQWLVFRLIRILFIYLFIFPFFFLFFLNWKEQKLGWWRRRILLYQPDCRTFLEQLDKILFREWLMINFKSMAIHNKRSLRFINGLDSDRSIAKDLVNIIWPKPMSLKFSFKIFKLRIK